MSIVIGQVQSTAVPLEVAENSNIISSEINESSLSIVNTLSSITEKLNTIIGVIESLPEETGISAVTNALDGANIYTDSDATLLKDYGFLYNSDLDRPQTIYESFIFFAQILSNISNGLKEGVKIGSVSLPVEILTAATATYAWPYTDGLFEAMLFETSGGYINKVDNNVKIDTSTGEIIITNGTGSTQNIFGYIWHPVLTF